MFTLWCMHSDCLESTDPHTKLSLQKHSRKHTISPLIKSQNIPWKSGNWTKMCYSGKKCYTYNCIYNHPSGRPKVCKFANSCLHRKICSFIHPSLD